MVSANRTIHSLRLQSGDNAVKRHTLKSDRGSQRRGHRLNQVNVKALQFSALSPASQRVESGSVVLLSVF